MQHYILDRYHISQKEFLRIVATMDNEFNGGFLSQQVCINALKAIVRIHEPCLKIADDIISAIEADKSPYQSLRSVIESEKRLTI